MTTHKPIHTANIPENGHCTVVVVAIKAGQQHDYRYQVEVTEPSSNGYSKADIEASYTAQVEEWKNTKAIRQYEMLFAKDYVRSVAKSIDNILVLIPGNFSSPIDDFTSESERDDKFYLVALVETLVKILKEESPQKTSPKVVFQLGPSRTLNESRTVDDEFLEAKGFGSSPFPQGYKQVNNNTTLLVSLCAAATYHAFEMKYPAMYIGPCITKALPTWKYDLKELIEEEKEKHPFGEKFHLDPPENWALDSLLLLQRTAWREDIHIRERTRRGGGDDEYYRAKRYIYVPR